MGHQLETRAARICRQKKYAVNESAFFSDSLESQSYEFIEIALIGPYYGVKNFVRIAWSFEKIEKWLFFGHSWANFGCFSHPSHTILTPLRTQEPLWV